MNRTAIRAMAVMLTLSLPTPQALPSQKPATSASPLEVSISGPRLISRGDRLKFKVTLTNRSDKTIAIRFPFFDGDTTRFIWRITDASDHLLPWPIPGEPLRGYCPLVTPPSDRNIEILEPGQTFTYDYADDPSDYFVFHGKGFYKVSLRYILGPPREIHVCDNCPDEETKQKYPPEQKIEMLKSMPRIEATSDVWNVYLVE